MVQDAANFFRAFYFDEEQYLSNKTAALNTFDSSDKHWTVEDTRAAIAGAGLSAWEHFSRYGAFEQAADGGMGIDPGNLFDVDAYYNTKLQECQKSLGITYTKEELAGIFRDTGLDPITHYARHGYAESIVPTAEASAPVHGHASQQELFRELYFNQEQYLANKTNALNAEGAEGKTWTTEDTAAAFAKEGLTAWEHFTRYGAFEQAADGSMGIDPSQYFDLGRYYQSKIAQCLKDEGTSYTTESLVGAFREAGLDPITHYALHGYLEGVAPVMENLPEIEGAALADVPLSGNALIDSLLFMGWNEQSEEIPLKNWNKVGAEQGNVLYYTLPATSDVQNQYIGNVAPKFSALNPQQEKGYKEALDAASDVTGITFHYTSDASKANLYFFTAEDPDPNPGEGITLGWTEFSTLYDDKVAVILTASSAYSENANPSFGNSSFLTIVHELGHALGLKHPFDKVDELVNSKNWATLPNVLDNEAWTSMSYTNPQEQGEAWFEEGKSYYSPFDLLALNYLYGTDGLNGSEGIVYNQPMQLV